MPLNLIHVTAEYSNAVLVAILPYVSDFAHKLDLPVQTPVLASQVSHCTVYRLLSDRRNVEGTVMLTNELRFYFAGGIVVDYTTPRDYGEIQDASQIKDFYGKLNLDRESAIRMAKEIPIKLGYNLKDFGCDKPPRVSGPFENDGKLVPFYLIEWANRAEPDGPIFSVSIDGEKKTFESIHIIGSKLFKAPPKLSVEPELEKDYQERVKKSSTSEAPKAPD